MPAKAKSARPAKSATPKRAAVSGARLSDALAEAAWSEADAALAEAMALSEEAANASDDDARAAALDLLDQALGRAARKRGLTRFGKVGAREAYDAKRHELIEAVTRAPKTVHVMARGVARGRDILVKPRVGAAGRKQRT